ncbi:MAG TPA: DUF1998 domain-containing protein [Syntrophorhabdus sp.]|nr:DUF1998 domain-containing protein [Syntrophorhabdus sp.]
MSRPIRRTQAISPFGIGAMVDFPGPVSLIHAGLDAWPFNEGNPDHREFRIDDEKRLSRRLNVDFFIQPPDYRKPERGQDASQINLNLKLPFLRFPLWHVCPRCGRMHLARFHDIAAPTCKGPIGSGGASGEEHHPRKAVQVRFVAACKKGHLQDFPWLEWLFKQSNPEWKPEGNSRWLRMRSTGSASLTSVEVRAEEKNSKGVIRVIERRTLAGAFIGDPTSEDPSALARTGILCEGHNPVLAIGRHRITPLPGCGQELYPLLRGASNLYFPQVVSSIYIPDIDDRELPQETLDLLDDYQFRMSLLLSAQDADNGLVSEKAVRNALRKYYPESAVKPDALAGAANKHILADVLLYDRKIHAFLSQKIKVSTNKKLTVEMIAAAIKSHFPDWGIDPLILLPAMSEKLEGKTYNVTYNSNAQEDTLIESDYRQQEYRVFCRDIQEGYPKTNLLIRSSDVKRYGELINSSFDHVSLLHKLRETRTFVGFSRIFPDELNREEQWKLISKEKKRWLPAVIVRGEGIFLKFNDDRLNRWLNNHGAFHKERLSGINANLGKMRERRHQTPKIGTPKYVLIHTFAHLIINQLVYQCGYGSASLRERIYVTEGEKPMSGVLIYTAAGDSEGTMGGLVRMGQPDCLGEILTKALEKALWCSTDPVCIESRGQGPGNCNLGACHSCALLPETSCEEQNRLLDRGVVIGTLEQPDVGYFSDILSELK